MMSSWRNTTAPPLPSVAGSGKSAAAVKFVLDYSVPLFSSHHRNNHKAPSSSISISSSASSSSSSSSSTYVNDEDTEFLFDEISSSSSDEDNDEDERASEVDEADDVVRGRASVSTKRIPAVPEGSAGLRSPHSSPYAISLDASTSSRPFHRPSLPTSAKPSSSASDPIYSDFLSYQTRNRERRISNQTRTTTSRRMSRQKRKTTSRRSSHNDHEDHDFDYQSRSSSQRSHQIQASEPLSPATYLHASLDMPFSPEVLAWKLERYLRLSEQATPQPLPVRSKQPASDQIDPDTSAALARLAEGEELDEQYERALRLAGWNKRGRAGTWEAPDDATSALRTLVASVD